MLVALSVWQQTDWSDKLFIFAIVRINLLVPNGEIAFKYTINYIAKQSPLFVTIAVPK